MIRALLSIFGGLLGLAFGSFLNVCVSRWPAGESVAVPRSHCRNCARTLAWWENVPLFSWIALRGRCRTCGVRIGVRYVIVEAAVGAIWAYIAWLRDPEMFFVSTEHDVAMALLCFVLVGIAALDAEQFWIPDLVTLPMITLGILWNGYVLWRASRVFLVAGRPIAGILLYFAGIICSAGIILIIRWLYWILRRKEGIGLGDAKLMAVLAAWLGFPNALLSFGIGVVVGAGIAVLVLLRGDSGNSHWAAGKLPLGTFLCAGGIVSSLWGPRIIEDYLRWAGF